MRNLTEQLTNYAEYHRDRRNIATHFVGIPMIVLATVTLLSRPPALALAAAIAASLFYFVLDRRYGLVMSALLGLALWAGHAFAAMSTSTWLGAGLGLFVLGWAIQFVGHIFERRKPAFVDDLIGLLVGPLFIVAEAGFALGLRDDLRRDIEAKAGPTRARTPVPQAAS